MRKSRNRSPIFGHVVCTIYWHLHCTMYCICNILASVVKVNILTSSFLLILNVQCMYNVAASFCGHWNHGLRTPNQRNLKIWANMLRPYLKIWEWECIFSHAVKAISPPDVRSLWLEPKIYSRLRCLLRVKGFVICFYLAWSGSILQFRKI